jgi:hypothetical protein
LSGFRLRRDEAKLVLVEEEEEAAAEWVIVVYGGWIKVVEAAATIFGLYTPKNTLIASCLMLSVNELE